MAPRAPRPAASRLCKQYRLKTTKKPRRRKPAGLFYLVPSTQYPVPSPSIKLRVPSLSRESQEKIRMQNALFDPAIGGIEEQAAGTRREIFGIGNEE